MIIELILIFLSASLSWFLMERKRKLTFPPGPFRLPIIGNILQLRMKSSIIPVQFHEMSKTYGDIMSLKSDKSDSVVLSSVKMIHEFLGREELSGRISEGAGIARNLGKNMGIIFSSGGVWKDIRRFSIRNLRDFGFGKSSTMEIFIQEEMNDLIKRMRKTVIDSECTDGAVIHMQGYFTMSAISVLWSLMMGERIAHDNPKLLRLIEIGEEWSKNSHFVSGFILMFPILRDLFPTLTGRTLQDKSVHALWEYFRELVRDHRKRQDYKENPKNFVDLFLIKVDDEKENENSSFNDEQLVSTIIDMFQGGAETSNSVVSFAILYLILNPSCQTKAQIEIDRVVPKDRFPILADREELIYTQALMLEVYRFANIVPIPIPRMVMKDFSHMGYTFKKGCAVLQNNYTIFNNLTFWGDPETFRPERFIGMDGKIDKTKEAQIIIFGYGKRVCPAESLANTTIFLCLSTLLQQFRFKTVPRRPKPSTVPLGGFVYTPQAFDVSIQIRNQCHE